jgi:hypothetical protein
MIAKHSQFGFLRGSPESLAEEALARFLSSTNSNALSMLTTDRVEIPDRITVDCDELFSGWSIRPSSLIGASSVDLSSLSVSGLRTFAFDRAGVSLNSDFELVVPMSFQRLTVSGEWATALSKPEHQVTPVDERSRARSGGLGVVIAGLSLAVRVWLPGLNRFSLQCKGARIEGMAIDLTVNGMSEFKNRLLNLTINAEAVIEKIKPAAIEMLLSESGLKRFADLAFRRFALDKINTETPNHSKELFAMLINKEND